MMQLSIRPSLSLLACFLLVGLSISSCTGGGTTSSTGSMTLNVAQNSNSFSYFPLYVAEQKNFFNAQGLTLNPAVPPQLGTGPKMTAAVESGSVEIAAGTISDAFTLSRVDSYIRILGTLSTDLEIDITVSKSFEQQTHLSAASPLADRVKALVGKKIGVTGIGAATEAFLIYLFKQQGLDALKDITIVNLGGSNTVAGLAALSIGRVDAISFPVPAGVLAETQNIGDRFISQDTNRNDLPALQGQTNCILYAKQSVIDSKPKAVQAFIRAIAQAEAFIQHDPDQATVLLGAYLKQKNVKALSATMLPSFAHTPQVSQQSYNAAMQFQVDAGLLAIALPYKDLVATDTINKALA